jgi:hypothetical protein
MTEQLGSLRSRLDKIRRSTPAINLRAYELDYVISFLLVGLMQVDELRQHIVFKGGTALRKCYFKDYRFSEDLDFSALKGTPTGSAMEMAIQAACNHAERVLLEYEPAQFSMQRYPEKNPHPFGQEAFIVRAKLPWQTHEHTWTKLKLEISIDEEVLRYPLDKGLIHNYGEPLSVMIPTYTLEEIIAEKLRALLQWAKKLDERSFAKPRARDYYDLSILLANHEHEVDLSAVMPILKLKCKAKGVDFSGVDSFFVDNIVHAARMNWQGSLSNLVPNLPDFDNVIVELHTSIAALLQ